MNLELTPKQHKIVSAGLTILSAAIIIIVTVAVLFYLAKFFKNFSHVFLPLAVAAVLATVLDPWYRWLNQRVPSVVALVAVFLSVVIPLGVIFIVFGALIANQLAELLDQLPTIWAAVGDWIRERRPELERMMNSSDVGSKLRDAFTESGDPIMALLKYMFAGVVSASSSVVDWVVSLLGWVIVPVYLAFFLLMPGLRPSSLTEQDFPFLKTETAGDVIYLIQEFFNLVVVFFRGQIVIALLQGILFAIGFSLVGLKYGAVIGFLLGMLNVVPYLGSMVGLSICLPTAWFQDGGGPTLLVLVLAVFSLVQMIEGYFLTPKIMGDATGLSPLLIIVGIFFWGAALDGILGMILAIPLTAFFVVVWKLGREKYFVEMI
ncbi:MAG: AI-2E family transporter [Arenicellales bacterium]